MAKRRRPVILVTAGGTREPIDPVRYIGNRSSGKMGLAILKACLRKGLKAVFIHGEISEKLPPGKYKRIHVETTEEMNRAVNREFKDCDILFMAAAPADFRPLSPAKNKIKKRDGKSGRITLELVPTPDILGGLRRKKSQVVVGFAAETENLLVNAKEKRARKNLDFLVANDVTRSDSGFGTDTNKAWIIHRDGSVADLRLMSKNKLGGLLLKTALYCYHRS
jgi:phosphopantothenoylcysteine decarboxylase/phosphopantothenate--cysteine ligase